MTDDQERKERWTEARRLWLGGLSNNTRLAYGQAWRLFGESCAAAPWEVSRADVARWVQEMRERGLSDGTIGQRVAALGSYYRYCCEEYQVVVDGREMPLSLYNPAAGKSLRPRVERYGKARPLSDEECRALLAAVRQEANSPQGLRDYALMIGYIFTGRRNSEWRTARWGDFEEVAEVIWYRWSGKGKEGKLEIPSPVWGAVKAMLMVEGRFMRMQAEDYIFRGQATQGKPGENRPIASNQVGRLLKKYCRAAGLNADEIHVHSLRHTAARLRRTAGGESLEDVSRWMVHSSLAVTQVYLQRVEQPRDESWRKVGAALGIVAEDKDNKRSYRPYTRRRA